MHSGLGLLQSGAAGSPGSGTHTAANFSQNGGWGGEKAWRREGSRFPGTHTGLGFLLGSVSLGFRVPCCIHVGGGKTRGLDWGGTGGDGPWTWMGGVCCLVLEVGGDGEMEFVASGVLRMAWGSIWSLGRWIDETNDGVGFRSSSEVLCPGRFPARGHDENAGLEENLTRAGG